MTPRHLAVLTLLFAVVVAGCSGAINPAPGGQQQTPDQTPGDMADPDEDVIGWEDGVWHNESIAVNQSDGLNDSELQAYVARGMARVEYIREREFQERVPVRVISREEYQSGDNSSGGDFQYQSWNDQVWEGLWIVGESRSFQDAISSTRGASVSGFYSPSEDAITIITPSPDSPTISNGTLIHELTHALQDQYGVFDQSGLNARTQDTQLATDAVIEGEANYVEDRYQQRCGVAWACVRSPGGGGGSLPDDFNFGLFVTIFFPYSDGPPWLAEIVADRGWSAIEDAYEEPPVSTEQVIHDTDEEPIELSFSDTAQGSWERYRTQGVDGADTVGEASIFAMFWYQSRTYDADIVDVPAIGERENPYDTYNYQSPPSEGWGNDLLVPYRNNTGADGYVWKTVWDSPEDAQQFHDAYLEILDAHDAEYRGNNTYVVSEGPFADAFRVVRNDTYVTIVNGPTAGALEDIRPREGAPGSKTTAPSTSGALGPGFGLTAAIAAALAIVLFLIVRQRRE